MTSARQPGAVLTDATSAAGTRARLAKVPQVTAIFWIIKVLTTGMGETASDFLAHTVAPPVAVGLGALGLAVALVLQFRVRRYLAGVYWFAVIMVSVFGTMAADVLHVGLGVPYLVSTIGFAVALAAVLLLWYASERTLSIHSITTPRRELFYWATVLATFALGTAAGDLTAVTFGWGYLLSGVIFAAAIAVPALAFRTGTLNAVAAFWTAYVITRPLGASFADWMGVSHERGGLGLGTGSVTVAWTVLIVVLVGYLAVTRVDAEPAGR
ncbi:COG4705 family protein [Dactylosporangium darangshiense]|uniref:Membrane protein n=1 Tax=Dactylosporangium darangshiense TaxID=579108 RepID=A0ABP8DPS0_9ACTN